MFSTYEVLHIGILCLLSLRCFISHTSARTMSRWPRWLQVFIRWSFSCLVTLTRVLACVIKHSQAEVGVSCVCQYDVALALVFAAYKVFFFSCWVRDWCFLRLPHDVILTRQLHVALDNLFRWRRLVRDKCFLRLPTRCHVNLGNCRFKVIFCSLLASWVEEKMQRCVASCFCVLHTVLSKERCLKIYQYLNNTKMMMITTTTTTSASRGTLTLTYLSLP